ncbi:hypothetical protein JMM81_17045 [Bacillus sp. V3B]|uniref:hypothetical protein n=1 Tax=Bacillus sp. V3B TaxID=2804915 RepID=UPI00210CD980|nr:hypothetical protein [Bacillus sp. V3B]MCQ6276622.1 hypothetical protein [Bacillus sp. V3B]
MIKIAQMIENIREDVNEENSVTLTLFNNMLQISFKILIFLGIPFLIYVLILADKLN